ncbi:hypothetical protein [Flexithrix dorotheae]|uniref:hypothetical protein n=1 Tax=Flexithrix dorotheae TaxID=70993 RepID=UPI0003693A8E|nr:hypothetical protein [Flexithrix dorotheae]
MKKSELSKLNFKSFLRVCYPEIEPHLLRELERLRDEIITLPESSSENTLLTIFEKSVNNLNRIDEDNSIDARIDTEEREGLCSVLYTMGETVGLDVNTEFIDNWRDW